MARQGSAAPPCGGGPLADARRCGVAVVRRHRRGAHELAEEGGRWIDAVTGGHRCGGNRPPWGHAAAVVDAGQALAPAVLPACAPGGVRVAVAERGAGFGLRPQQSTKGLQDRAAVRRAPRQGGMVEPLWASAGLEQVWGVLEPAGLGVEAHEPPWLQAHAENAPGRMRVDARPFARRARRRRLPTAVKKRTQPRARVGQGRCDNGGSSWRAWPLAARQDLRAPTMSMHHAHPSYKFSWKIPYLRFMMEYSTLHENLIDRR